MMKKKMMMNMIMKNMKKMMKNMKKVLLNMKKMIMNMKKMKNVKKVMKNVKKKMKKVMEKLKKKKEDFGIFLKVVFIKCSFTKESSISFSNWREKKRSCVVEVGV